MTNADPRKKPQQPRARNTVKRILAATADIVEELGVDAITTNLIAERANVNIASLYQYFPNKEAIVTALLESYFQEISHTLNAVLMAQTDMAIADSTRLWSHAALSYFRERQGLLTLLVRLQQNTDELSAVKVMEYRLREAMRRFLAPRREALNVPDLELAIQVSYIACTAVLTRHLLDPLPYHSDEAVVAEVVRLMVGYFQ